MKRKLNGLTKNNLSIIMKRILIIFIIFTLFCTISSLVLSSSSPWPMFRHDPQHTGRSPYKGNEINMFKWKFSTRSNEISGNIDSSPVIGPDGTIYVLAGSFCGPLGVTPCERLWAINPNGTLKWKGKIEGTTRSSPAIGSDGTIYFGGGSDYNFYAINPNGRVKWKFRTEGRIDSSPAIGSDGTIYFGSREGYLYAINPNGTLKWKIGTGGQVSTSPAIGSDGTIYFRSSDGYLYAINPNGTLKWKIGIGGIGSSSPAIGSDGTIYVVNVVNLVRGNDLCAINPNGTLKWKLGIGNIGSSSPAIGSDGTIYIGLGYYFSQISLEPSGYLCAINPNGTSKWTLKIEPVDSPPTIDSEGTIYIGSTIYNGWRYLYAINPNGSIFKRFTIEGSFAVPPSHSSSPTIGSDGTIYIGSNDANLCAIGSPVSSLQDSDTIRNEDKIEKELTFKTFTINMKTEVEDLLPMLTWDKTYGEIGNDWASSLIQTTDGGYAVAGRTESKDVESSYGWIIKLDEQWNMVWNRAYGGTIADCISSLIQTTDGGYAGAGKTYSKGAGEIDAWIIKVDEQGNIAWHRTYGGSKSDWVFSLIQTTDGGYAVAGITESKGAGEIDAWIIKLDEQGNKIWDRTYGGSKSNWVFSLIQTTDGGYAATGWTDASLADAWVIKLDEQGNKVWDKTYGGIGNDLLRSLIQTTDGGYTAAGSTKSKGAGEEDAWIIKLDEQGNLISNENNLDYDSQTSSETCLLTGSLHCPNKRGYPCTSCSSVKGYINHFKGFNVLTTNKECYVKLIYNNGDYIGNQNNCEVIIKGEKWLGLENESGTKLVEEINKGNFDFTRANKFVERTMNFPEDNYKYEFANNGKEFRLYLSGNREETFKAVPWQNITIEIKNKETDKVFKYNFQKGIFPQAYSWSNGVANYGQCVWWAAKRWVEEVDSKTLFPFYPASPQDVNVIKIDSNYHPKRFDILIDYDPRQTGELGHYDFVEKIEGDKMYISQFNWIKPGEVYNYIIRTWNGNATNLFYSYNPSNEYYFKYYYRK